MNDKNFEKITLTSSQAYSNVRLYEISVNLKDLKFGTKFAQKNMNEIDF